MFDLAVIDHVVVALRPAATILAGTPLTWILARETERGRSPWKASHLVSARHHTCAVKAAQQTFHDLHLVAESGGQRWP